MVGLVFSKGIDVLKTSEWQRAKFVLLMAGLFLFEPATAAVRLSAEIVVFKTFSPVEILDQVLIQTACSITARSRHSTKLGIVGSIPNLL